MRYPWLVLLSLVCSTAVLAQAPAAPNPTLVARERGINDELHRRALRMGDLKVEVDIVGTIARATVRARFLNSTGEQLEGDFTLALPDGAIVTGYALDIQGRMIDGVLAEPSRARAVYEARLRQGIDPGVGEVSRGNVFTTQVFPINADTGRTILVSFVAPVHALSGWVLPVTLTQSVRRIDFQLRAREVARAPNLVLPAPLAAQWRSEGNTFVAQASAKNQKLSGELRLAPVAPASPLLTTRHTNGQRFFQLNEDIAASAVARAAPKRLRIYWDRSLSHGDDALDAEISLIRDYLQKAKPATVDVVLFNSTGIKLETRTTADAVTDVLKRVVYRGGSSFAVLQGTSVPPAPLCLMVSDGVATVDPRDTFKPDCELIALSSAPDADIGYLARLMGRSPSEVLRVEDGAKGELLARLQSVSPTVSDVRDGQGAALKFTQLPAPAGKIAVVGEAPAAGAIVVRVSNGAKSTERRYAVADAPVAFDGAGALWAADQVLRLAAADEKKQLFDVSRRYEVASPHLSFVVLESPWDYADAGLAPPRRYPAEWRKQYAEDKAIRERSRKDEAASHLEEVLECWNERKEWWATRFDSAPPPSLTNRRCRRWSSFGGNGGEELDALQEVTTTATRAVPSGVHVELEPWSVKRPYITALNKAPPGQFDEVLAAQEKRHGNLPAFYLDVAEWFYQHQRTPEAIEMALTALELPARNDETLAIVADRMARYGDLDRAIALYERLLELAPDRPQPRRSLALALAEHAGKAGPAVAITELTRALSLMNEVIRTPWIEGYEGIDVIAITEANAIFARLQKLGVKNPGFDRRFVARMDMDLRVVIEWNTPATDIDLWVEEPNTEVAMYSNPLTGIGGHLSNDMRRGFGPEEYLLRRAPNGTFKVSANVYAVDQLNPNGASTVTARLIYDYGRPTERVERRDIELAPGKEDEHEVLIGKVTFKRAKTGLLTSE